MGLDNVTCLTTGFLTGCRVFIARFCAMTMLRVPRLLQWSELQVLDRFLAADKQTRALLDQYLLEGVPQTAP